MSRSVPVPVRALLLVAIGAGLAATGPALAQDGVATGEARTAAGARVPGRDRFLTTARVVDVRPVFADVTIREPRVECTGRAGRPDVRVFESRNAGHGTDPRAATIVGGLVGGAIGHRLVRDRSDGTRAAGTVAGALLGAGAGRGLVRGHDRYRHARGFGAHDRGRRHRYGYGSGRERCVRTVEVREERRLIHHDVTYVLRGRTLRARRAVDPGDTIEIDVSLPPSAR